MMTPEQLLAQVEFFGSAKAAYVVAHAAHDHGAAATFAAEAATALHKVQAEIEKLEAERPGNDLSEDLHSAKRCGQPGMKSCPGCIIDGLREELKERDRVNLANLGKLLTAERELDAMRPVVEAGKALRAFANDPITHTTQAYWNAWTTLIAGVDALTATPTGPPATVRCTGCAGDPIACAYCQQLSGIPQLPACYHCGSTSKGNPKCPVCCRPQDRQEAAKTLPIGTGRTMCGGCLILPLGHEGECYQ